MNIKSIDAYQIYDSRGKPTVEVVVELDNGIEGVGWYHLGHRRVSLKP